MRDRVWILAVCMLLVGIAMVLAAMVFMGMHDASYADPTAFDGPVSDKMEITNATVYIDDFEEE